MAVGGALCEALDQLDGDVGGVEVREDEHVAAAGDLGALADLLCGDGGVDGGVELELAVGGDVRAALVDELDGLVHAVHALTGARALGREGEEAHARLPAHDGLDAVGGRDGDGGQLRGVGLGVEPAVGEADHAALGALEAGGLDEREDGGDVDALGQADGHLGGHEDVAGGVHVAAEGAVHVAELLHDHGPPHRVLEFAADALGGEHAGLAGVHEAGRQRLERLGVGGVDDLHALEGDPGLLGGGGDHVGGGDEHRGADAVVEHAARGLEGLCRLALGQGDAGLLLAGLSVLGELLDKRHCGSFLYKRGPRARCPGPRGENYMDRASSTNLAASAKVTHLLSCM